MGPVPLGGNCENRKIPEPVGVSPSSLVGSLRGWHSSQFTEWTALHPAWMVHASTLCSPD